MTEETRIKLSLPELVEPPEKPYLNPFPPKGRCYDYKFVKEVILEFCIYSTYIYDNFNAYKKINRRQMLKSYKRDHKFKMYFLWFRELEDGYSGLRRSRILHPFPRRQSSMRSLSLLWTQSDTQPSWACWFATRNRVYLLDPPEPEKVYTSV